jgi:penicillin-binding protein 2
MSLGIGQSSLLVTPIQVAQMMATLANGGRGVPLTMAEPRGGGETLIPAAHLQALTEGMRLVVSGPHGTARDSGLAKFAAAGKTSSAQTVKGKEAHAWFAGYAPADRPKYAVVVLVEYGTSGGHAAAPIVAQILQKLNAP